MSSNRLPAGYNGSMNTNEEHKRSVTIDIDEQAVSNGFKGFILGYCGVIALTVVGIALCFLTLIIASAFLR